MDKGKPEVQNMNLFKRRILGLVSYFPDIEALLPKFEKENPDNKFFTGRTPDAPFRLWFKKINFFGGSYLYSAMDKDQLADVFWGYINDIAHDQSR